MSVCVCVYNVHVMCRGECMLDSVGGGRDVTRLSPTHGYVDTLDDFWRSRLLVLVLQQQLA